MIDRGLQFTQYIRITNLVCNKKAFYKICIVKWYLHKQSLNHIIELEFLTGNEIHGVIKTMINTNKLYVMRVSYKCFVYFHCNIITLTLIKHSASTIYVNEFKEFGATFFKNEILWRPRSYGMWRYMCLAPKFLLFIFYLYITRINFTVKYFNLVIVVEFNFNINIINILNKIVPFVKLSLNTLDTSCRRFSVTWEPSLAVAVMNENRVNGLRNDPISIYYILIESINVVQHI
ncbi:hypothetical protein AGLY_008057 [Aphis glycines]|uniref:Uncharacterized protein n=1 Tax=Aphis glycines TaxID=307491 RepID=A0A6G0TKR1_APHGL|nr:hypothetical protein AGLY_008057 [Aphis glycines]